MTINISIQRISHAVAKSYGGAFSTVEIRSEDTGVSDISLFFHNNGHMDTAARIAALINDDAARQKPTPLPYENSATFPPESDEDEQARLEQEEADYQEQQREERNAELGPRAAAFPYEEEQALEQANKLRDFDGEVF